MLLADISEKFNEMQDLSGVLDILLNTVLQEAIGKPGEPSNLDMLIYLAKQVAAIYNRLIEWGLYFKTIHTDEIFNKLLSLLCELPGHLMNRIDEFVEKTYNEIMELPDVEDGVKRKIVLTCTLDGANLNEITKEFKRLSTVLD